MKVTAMFEARLRNDIFPLLADLATLTRNITAPPLNYEHELILYARPTPIQAKAFDRLGIKPERTR
jgi:hypothetical protein